MAGWQPGGREAIDRPGVAKLFPYKKGIENSVADALSRKYQDDDSESHPLPTTATCSAISVAVPSWLEDVHASYKDDAHCNKLL